MKRRWIRNPNPDAAWLAAHPGRNASSDPKPPRPVKEKLLRVSTGYFVAGSVWRKISNVWSCVKTAPILHWMKGKTPDQVHLILLKMQADYEWVETDQSQTDILAVSTAQK